MLLYYLSGGIGLLVGILIASILNRKNRQYYDRFIEQYLNVETHVHRHIREHVLRDKDLTWAAGLPPIVTFGIKADGSVMTVEEIEEARLSVVDEEKDGLVRWAQNLI